MRRPASSTRAPCANPFCVSANSAISPSTAYFEANFCSKKVVEFGRMTITISEITDSEQWDAFLTSQPRGHLLQSYEWGELNKYLGGHIYRLGALDNGRLVGAMLVLVAQIPLPVKVPGIHFNWLYCCRGPALEKLDAPTLSALIQYTHSIARKEHAVILRLEPNIASGDPDEDEWLAAYRALGFHINPIAVHGRRGLGLALPPT